MFEIHLENLSYCIFSLKEFFLNLSIITRNIPKQLLECGKFSGSIVVLRSKMAGNSRKRLRKILFMPIHSQRLALEKGSLWKARPSEFACVVWDQKKVSDLRGKSYYIEVQQLCLINQPQETPKTSWRRQKLDNWLRFYEGQVSWWLIDKCAVCVCERFPPYGVKKETKWRYGSRGIILKTQSRDTVTRDVD